MHQTPSFSDYETPILMKLKQLVCLLGLATSFSLHADTLSVSIGGGAWNESPSGNFQKTSDGTNVDVKDSLFWDKESQGYFFATVEHFAPLLPNVRLMHTKIDHAGSGTAAFTFDGKTFGGNNVSNEVSIETTDLIAYYEILDNVVSLDIGLNIRSLNVDYSIVSASQSAADSFSATFPMLYALVGTSPWPDLTISGEVSYIAFSGSSMSDITAKIAYTTNFLVGVEAGYRKQNITLDDTSGNDAELTFDGIFAGAYLKF